MQEITVEELRQWREEGRDFVLLDVRELFELNLAALDGIVHIPMREIPARMSEFDTNATIAVLCHHGNRSGIVTQYLAGNGFGDVHNVAGGIKAWADRVDHSVGRY